MRDHQPPPTIVDLPALLDALPAPEREIATRILRVTVSTGRLIAPSTMQDWLIARFGDLAAVQEQTIVKTMNLVTLEGTVFNPLRAERPFDVIESDDLAAAVRGGADPFCSPLEGTPEDTFGRVYGHHCLTASNIAKYDGLHAVIVFGEHHPLHFDRDAIADTIDVALRWGQRALEVDPAARYLFIMWNCLWKAGASIIHGHAQVAATRDLHYARIEALRRQAAAYRAQYGTSYFVDLVRLSEALGLAFHHGRTTGLASLTPLKEKEILLLDAGVTRDLSDAIGHVLERFLNTLGVTSFNLALLMPPLRPAPEDWSAFPHLVRIVDRGPLHLRTTDVGAMELYAASVVSSDPFAVAAALR